jgi:CelD/BcsL family acetyltransferase involved in cellulose biosynthesis
MHSNNPTVLSDFVREFMNSVRLKGWTPVLLVILADKTIVGIVPLMMRRKFGIRYAFFLPFLTSFVATDDYREICVSKTLDFLFRTLHCQFVRLVLSTASQYTAILRQECHEKKIHLSQVETLGQSILPIRSTWHEFAKSRGKKFLQDIRRTERKLGHVGRWRCLRVEEADRPPEVLEQMTRIDCASWKQFGRTRKGYAGDESIALFWNGSQCASRTVPNFKSYVWFLEVNDRKIAYALFFSYKDVTFAAKTSYELRYARLGPGIYLMNTAIREIFEEGQVNTIDFISDVPFTKTWTSLRMRRINFTMTTGISKIIVALFCEGTFGREFQRLWGFLCTMLARPADVFPFFDLFV